MNELSTEEKLDPNRLATFLHSHAEKERREIARELHDNLGGLIVGAMMDAAWAEKHLPARATESQEKLTRLLRSLGSAMDLKRRLIEDIRPSLLDNVGLLAALGWLTKTRCQKAGLEHTLALPDKETQVNPDTAITLFRFVQELLALVEQRELAKSVGVDVQMEPTRITIQVTADGSESLDTAEFRSAQFESLHHRIKTLGGQLSLKMPVQGYVAVSAVIPTDKRAPRCGG